MYLLICLTLGAIAIIATIAFFIGRHYNSPTYFLSQLPEKYKSYPALSENVSSPHHQVEQLFSGKPWRVYYDSIQQLVVVSRMEEISAPDTNSIINMIYYRLDANGKLLDSLHNSSATDELGHKLGGHLLYEKYYTNYLITGSTQSFPYVEKNADLSMPTATLRVLIDSLSAAADDVSVEHYSESIAGAMAFFFSINKQVHRVYALLDSHINTDSKWSAAFAVYNPIDDNFPVTGSYDWQDRYAFMQIDYFLKESYNRTRRPAIMSPAPMSRPAHWEGTGYYSISYTDDTLYFKHPVNYYPDKDAVSPKPYYQNITWGKLNFFCRRQLPFQLLTVGFDTSDKHALDGCYVVVKK